MTKRNEGAEIAASGQPILPRDTGELLGEVKWFRDLLKVAKSGDMPTVVRSVESAVKLLEKQLGERIARS